VNNHIRDLVSDPHATCRPSRARVYIPATSVTESEGFTPAYVVSILSHPRRRVVNILVPFLHHLLSARSLEIFLHFLFDRDELFVSITSRVSAAANAKTPRVLSAVAYSLYRLLSRLLFNVTPLLCKLPAPVNARGVLNPLQILRFGEPSTMVTTMLSNVDV
jgi:hypothetical protein